MVKQPVQSSKPFITVLLLNIITDLYKWQTSIYYGIKCIKFCLH